MLCRLQQTGFRHVHQMLVHCGSIVRGAVTVMAEEVILAALFGRIDCRLNSFKTRVADWTCRQAAVFIRGVRAYEALRRVIRGFVRIINCGVAVQRVDVMLRAVFQSVFAASA